MGSHGCKLPDPGPDGQGLVALRPGRAETRAFQPATASPAAESRLSAKGLPLKRRNQGHRSAGPSIGQDWQADLAADFAVARAINGLPPA